MFISKLSIKNFRLFDDTKEHEIKDFNIPNGKDDGSGLTVFVGENGCGKTTILDAISSAMLDYKADAFKLTEINNIKENRKK